MLKAREAAGLDTAVGWNTPEAVMMWCHSSTTLLSQFANPNLRYVQ